MPDATGPFHPISLEHQKEGIASLTCMVFERQSLPESPLIDLY